MLARAQPVVSDSIGEAIARFPAWRGRALHRVAERSRASVCIRSKRTDGPGSTTRRRPLWSTYDQLKNLAGLAARRVTFVLWPCWAPRVPRLQVSRSTTELLVCERTGICENARCLRLSYTRTSRRRKAKDKWSETCRIRHSESMVHPSRKFGRDKVVARVDTQIHCSPHQLLLPKFSHEAATRRRAYLELALSSVHS